MWRVDAYQIPYYSRGIEGEKRTHPKFADWVSLYTNRSYSAILATLQSSENGRVDTIECTQKKLQSICAVLTFDPQLKNILTFSVKDRHQLNYFICIKDFNAQTTTSLKLNLFSFFTCGCQHHQRKTICLYVYISDIRQIVGYRTPVFIQRFPGRLHITITYNLPHLRLWYADVVTVIA